MMNYPLQGEGMPYGIVIVKNMDITKGDVQLIQLTRTKEPECTR